MGFKETNDELFNAMAWVGAAAIALPPPCPPGIEDIASIQQPAHADCMQVLAA